MTDLLNALPKMKSGQDLRTALEVLPEYDTSIRNADNKVDGIVRPVSCVYPLADVL